MQLPLTLSIRARRPGFYPLENKFYVTQELTTLELEQARGARFAFDVYLNNVIFPGFEFSYFPHAQLPVRPRRLHDLPGRPPVLRATATRTSLFVSQTLNLLDLGVGTYLNDADRNLRAYAGLGGFLRLVTSKGYFGLEPIAPGGLQAFLGIEYSRRLKQRFYLEFDPLLYFTSDTLLADRLLPGQSEAGGLRLLRQGRLLFPEPPAGVSVADMNKAKRLPALAVPLALLAALALAASLAGCSMPPYNEELSLAQVTRSKLGQPVNKIGPVYIKLDDSATQNQYYFLPERDDPVNSGGFLVAEASYGLRVWYLADYSTAAGSLLVHRPGQLERHYQQLPAAAHRVGADRRDLLPEPDPLPAERPAGHKGYGAVGRPCRVSPCPTSAPPSQWHTRRDPASFRTLPRVPISSIFLAGDGAGTLPGIPSIRQARPQGLSPDPRARLRATACCPMT